ncbi:MAG TPA: hypothetical protein VF184_02350 [Phycisphaeraceae bacterium]
MPQEPASSFEPLHPQRLTWAAMLGRWVQFARQAVGLPQDDAGVRMRQSVPDIIMLQAVWFALEHLEEVDPQERALGLDRAELLIDQHATALEERWRSTPMPAELRRLIDDARTQLKTARQRYEQASH